MALARVLELGVGMHPQPSSTVRHDRIVHSPHVDISCDLEELPWKIEDYWDQIVAIDVFEHLDLMPQQWLDQCWNLLVPDGTLTMRLPAWDNPLSYRDPTHRRVFHPESFYYWDPDHPLHSEFGSYYFLESDKWWKVVSVAREASDLKYVMSKRA